MIILMVIMMTFDDRELVQVDKRCLDNIVKLILEGLTTDGVNQKQYYLERIFKDLCMDSYVDVAKKEFNWTEGIPG